MASPCADNTKQFRTIVTIHSNIADLFAHDPDVFVAGDLLWYPVEGNNASWAAPDVMVVFGRPPGHRGSYLQWREATFRPKWSSRCSHPATPLPRCRASCTFTNGTGWRRYYLYDPDNGELSGWVRTELGLDEIPTMEGWVSPRLGIRFGLEGMELLLFRPDDSRFETYTEVREQLSVERERAKQERERAERLADRLRALGVDPAQI